MAFLDVQFGQSDGGSIGRGQAQIFQPQVDVAHDYARRIAAGIRRDCGLAEQGCGLHYQRCRALPVFVTQGHVVDVDGLQIHMPGLRSLDCPRLFGFGGRGLVPHETGPIPHAFRVSCDVHAAAAQRNDRQDECAARKLEAAVARFERFQRHDRLGKAFAHDVQSRGGHAQAAQAEIRLAARIAEYIVRGEAQRALRFGEAHVVADEFPHRCEF